MSIEKIRYWNLQERMHIWTKTSIMQKDITFTACIYHLVSIIDNRTRF